MIYTSNDLYAIMRVFTAVEVPEAVKDKLLAASAEFDAKGITIVRREALHITLQFLGERDETETNEIVKDLDSVEQKPFRVSLNGLSYFEKNHPTVIFAKVLQGGSELAGIYDKLSSAILEKEEREYTPHVTLARVRYSKDNLALISRIKEHEYDDFGEFDVESVMLKKSILTGGGPVYKNLYEKKLRL